MFRFKDPWLLAVLLPVLYAGTPALAEDAACKSLLDAVTKVITTPHHAYSNEIAAFRNNQPRSSEVINTGDATYVMTRGKWIRSPMTPTQMLKQQKENRSTAKPACRHIRDEAVNGEAAAVYSVHDDTEAGPIDSTIWISKSRGLPLRQEMDMDVGGSKGKVHKSTRYDYANVHAPAGVQ